MILVVHYCMIKPLLCQPWADGTWQGLEKGMAGGALCHPLLGRLCGARSLQHSVSRKNLLGGCNPNLTELSNNTPSYSHRDKIFPSFYCFSILYKPDKRSTLLACRVFCLFVFFFLPKATVNVPDFNVSLYPYSLEKCNAKFPKNLLNV